jgi:DNA-binding PadR family transcriptional regulator
VKPDRLGEFEELTLLAICALDAPVYGVPVQQRVESVTGRTVTMGGVYGALDRLEAKGLVRSRFGEPTATRGGKRKRLYTPTAQGLRTVHELRQVRERLWRAIEARQ